MNKNVDLLGRDWDSARSMLDALQLTYEVTEISEGVRTLVSGPLRVIRQIESEGILQILVCKVPEMQ